MANIKSQKKRAITNLKTQHEKAGEKTALKTAIKDVLKAVTENDKEKATVALSKANSLLDKSITSHIKHGNYVARQKSRLAKAVNSL